MNTLLAALHKISSGISPILYHFTNNAGNVRNILKEDRFKLTTLVGTPSETAKPGAYYYLSTTRHKLGGYQLGKKYGAILILDGRKLSQNYTGDPIDYWGEAFRKIDPKKFEAEDRIWSKYPYIENASKYINEIHIMEDKRSLKEDREKRNLRQTLIEAKKSNIPIFVYTDASAFQHLNKKKATPLSELDLKTNWEENKWPSFKRTNPLSRWLELYYRDDREELSKDAIYVLNNYITGYWSKDSLVQLNNAIHNNKNKSEYIEPFIKVLRQNKWTNTKEFFDHLREKWSIVD